MSDPIISVENLGKSYLIGHDGPKERYTTLRDFLVRHVRHLGDRTRRALRGQSNLAGAELEEFWALKDVSFDVQRGEVVGIIGRNGAGKSTLLKVLSRITEPTTGRVSLRGRVASLLEVGTGFHPELTGRENVFLNGAILGMTRAEIKRKFDEIVAFAEVEKFLDTPVKRYSSGMYVRLAFAVAAHLEPEILIVDEVLAVGDAEFQKKCLGKMQDVAACGRTVLFVSHNMAAISALCTRSICLRQGRLQLASTTENVVTDYLSSSLDGAAACTFVRRRSESFEVTSTTLRVNGLEAAVVHSGQSATICIDYRTTTPDVVGKPISVSILLYGDGQKLVNLWSECYRSVLPLQRSGRIECRIPSWPFRNQRFRVDIYTHRHEEVHAWLEECLTFESRDGDYFGSGVITNPDQGAIFIDHCWNSYATE